MCKVIRLWNYIFKQNKGVYAYGDKNRERQGEGC